MVTMVTIGTFLSFLLVMTSNFQKQMDLMPLRRGNIFFKVFEITLLRGAEKLFGHICHINDADHKLEKQPV